jgi:ribosomal protein S18 acetylase RimI-like enzyme
MIDIVIRDATAGDVDDLLGVEEAFRREGTPEWSIMRREVFEFKVRAGSLVVAHRDRQLVGYIMWTLFWGFPFIEYARVVPEHRNQGIGTQMVQSLAGDSAARGHERLWSSTSDADALRWHERNGFERVGEIEWIWGRAHETVLIKPLNE